MRPRRGGGVSGASLRLLFFPSVVSLCLTTLLYFLYFPHMPRRHLKTNKQASYTFSSFPPNTSSNDRLDDISPSFHGFKHRCERLYLGNNATEADLKRGMVVPNHRFSLHLSRTGALSSCEEYLYRRRQDGFYHPETLSEVRIELQFLVAK